ncbi:MAG: GGDEF domain-containing protein [Gemmatimonadota bacterium]
MPDRKRSRIHAAPPEDYARLLQRKGDQKFRTVDLVRVFREALRKANEFIPSEWGAILLDDPETKTYDPRSRTVDLSATRLVVAACFGPDAREAVGRHFAAAGGLAGRSYLSGRTLVLEEPPPGPFFDESLDASLGPAPLAVLSTPLTIKATAIGAIQLVNRQRSTNYSQHDRELIEILADYIAINIQTALDAKTLEEISKRDYLTHLYNDWYFTLELQQLVRQEQPFSLIFLDLDNFKEVNDTYGHLVGAEVLIMIGQIVREAVEPPGMAARFGGDEFEIALPGVALEGGLAVAECIRSAIEGDLEHIIDGRNILADLTCSVGVTAYDPARDARDYKQLMQRVDQSMYEAKRKGKNRIVSLPVVEYREEPPRALRRAN